MKNSDPLSNSSSVLSQNHSQSHSKTILITGASSGFGKLTVPLLLERGHTVIAAIRGGKNRLIEVFPSEIQAYGDRLHAIDLHLEQPDSINKVHEWIDDQFNGQLDVLINNAGYGLFGALEDQTPAQLRHQFDVNFFGPTLLTRSLLPALRASHGRVLTVSSIAGLYTFPYYGSYNASKFALEAMFEGLYYELKSFGIQVALIEPGGFRTNFTQRSKVIAAGAYQPGSLHTKKMQSFENSLQKFSPRLGNPIRVARLIVRLCEKRHIALRNIVGTDARFLHLLFRLIPDQWRVNFESLIFREIVLKQE